MSECAVAKLRPVLQRERESHYVQMQEHPLPANSDHPAVACCGAPCHSLIPRSTGEQALAHSDTTRDAACRHHCLALLPKPVGPGATLTLC